MDAADGSAARESATEATAADATAAGATVDEPLDPRIDELFASMGAREQTKGEPAFEIVVRDGVPLVAGSYFVFPPLRQKSAEFAPDVPGRLLVTATDGSVWYADGVSTTGRVNVRLTRLEV